MKTFPFIDTEYPNGREVVEPGRSSRIRGS